MHSIEFMYWLQAYFEVCDVEQIKKPELDKIKNHLKMVDLVDGIQIFPFCTWLKGFLDSLETDIPSISQTTKMKNKLNNLFEHVVVAQVEEEEKESYGMQLSPSEISPLINC